MSVQFWTFLFIVLTFGLYIGIAIWSRASSTQDFYVAGKHVPPVANGMATAADWMSAASFISMAGLISFLGRDGAFYLMGWTGGYVLLALLLAPYLRKFGKFTVPDFIGDRYYSQSARMVAVFCAIVISFVYVCGQMQGAGIVFSRFLEVEIAYGVMIGMGIVFFYAVLGGMKGITYTQVAQYCVLIFAFMVPAIFISLLMTGQAIPQIGFGSSLTEAFGGGFLLDRLDGLGEQLGFPTYTEGQRVTQDVFFITAALMIGTAGLPHVIIRFFTVPGVREARKSAGYALLFIAILYTTAPAVAAFARTNLLDTVDNADYSAMPEWFSKWESTGLISFSDRNADGLIQYTGDPATNELEVNRDIMVLANPEIAELPNWVVALVAAGGLAAALSTAAGLLLVISSAVSHDLLKRGFMPEISEKKNCCSHECRSSWRCWWRAISASIRRPTSPKSWRSPSAWRPRPSSRHRAGYFPTAHEPPRRRLRMIAGFGFTAAYIIYFRFINPAVDSAEYWLFGISPEGIGAIGALLNLCVAWTVCRFTPPPPAEVQALVAEIRRPES